MLLGILIDASCIAWDENSDGSRGNCTTYDSTSFSLKIVLLAVLQKVLSAVCIMLANAMHKPHATDSDPLDPIVQNVD